MKDTIKNMELLTNEVKDKTDPYLLIRYNDSYRILLLCVLDELERNPRSLSSEEFQSISDQWSDIKHLCIVLNKIIEKIINNKGITDNIKKLSTCLRDLNHIQHSLVDLLSGYGSQQK